MNCSISGEVPEAPVISRKSGLLFEKRLIERHISDYGKCPITGEPLTMDDVIPVKTGKIVKPRMVQTPSIPRMIGMFQNEWDSLMLSNFALEQQLHTARQELSHALYQALMDSQTVVSKEKPRVRKAEKYTVAEDLLLIAAWEHTSEDVAIGTDQAKEQYWTRVWREYLDNKTIYPHRPLKSIINRFSTIRTKCLKFAGIVQSIEYANSSGMTGQDKLNEAIKVWSTEEKEKGVFKLLHCYQVLKSSPKWLTEVVHPNLSKNQAASESINLGENESGTGHVELERPIGKKRGKELMKNKRIKTEDTGESESSINFGKSQELLQKFHEQKMEVIMGDSKKMDEYLQLKKEKLELDREFQEVRVMTTDMTNLNEMQRKFLEMKQAKIFKKYFKE